MAAEPLRSALTSSGTDDTSLALPSDNKLRSGQLRVLDQVHTIKRSKSRKNGSLSPTSKSVEKLLKRSTKTTRTLKWPILVGARKFLLFRVKSVRVLNLSQVLSSLTHTVGGFGFIC
uniref:Uncharacterized protein n=1 Tax=Mola mola TaxID=94237 RepID=A0A3Q3WDM4_MOLML